MAKIELSLANRNSQEMIQIQNDIQLVFNHTLII